MACNLLHFYIAINNKLGIFDSYALKLLVSSEKNSTSIDEALKTLTAELKKYSKQISLVYIENDLNIIIEVINKNRKIINHTNAISTPKSEVSIETKSRHQNQNEFDRLKKLRQTSLQDFKIELKSSYDKEKITVYEINQLLNKND